MDYFEQPIEHLADWETLRINVSAFEPLIRQIYASENEPFKTPEVVADQQAAVFAVGSTEITIFPPANVLPQTRDNYLTERYSLTRLERLHLTAPRLKHAGFMFDRYQFYYVIYQPLTGICLADFAKTAEPLAKSTLGRQIGTALNQLNQPVAPFRQVVAAADTADWHQFGDQFTADRAAFLRTHPVANDAFVHGQLNGTNLVVTSGQVGFCHFTDAQRAAKETELVPVVLDAFAGDADFMAGLSATLAESDLTTALLKGLLVRSDGPQWVTRVMEGAPVTTVAALRARLTTMIGNKED